MMVNYKQLNVVCPICGLDKSITVPEAIFAQKKFGTIKIQVPMGAVCSEHQFIVFVDAKGTVRGYEKIDLHMAMPLEQPGKEEEGVLTLRVLIQMFGFYGLFSLIHAKIFNYPVYVIIDKDSDLYSLDIEVLNLIGDTILPEAYRGDTRITFIEETDLNNIKIKDKKALIMAHKNILQTPWEEKLKFEEEMIKNATEIIDDDEQIILLQQSIAKLIKEAEHSKSILENVKEIYEDELIERLCKDLMIAKIDHYRLTLIKYFIKQRFSPKLASKIKNKVEEFLDLL